MFEMSRKDRPRLILVTMVLSAVVLVVTLIGLLVALSSPKSSLDSSNSALNPGSSIRATVLPSPSPSSALWHVVNTIDGITTPSPVEVSIESSVESTDSPVSTMEQPTATTVAVEPTQLDTEPSDDLSQGSQGTISTWYGIGDIPYSSTQAEILETQMKELPSDAEFVIHVGDLRLSGDNLRCKLSEYNDAAYRMSFSHAPVFVILGDNDWTDCPNREEGLRFWKQTFVGFESKHWNPKFAIVRQPNREENFAFIHKGTLFMGLNIIGGKVHSASEWQSRLTEQAEWSIDLIGQYRVSKGGAVGRIVIFGHANPNNLHRNYFRTLQQYIGQELKNEIPVLYLNGDKHEWSYDADFYGQSSWLRIMVSGKGVDPPLRVSIDSASEETDPEQVFEIDRML